MGAINSMPKVHFTSYRVKLLIYVALGEMYVDHLEPRVALLWNISLSINTSRPAWHSYIDHHRGQNIAPIFSNS